MDAQAQGFAHRNLSCADFQRTTGKFQLGGSLGIVARGHRRRDDGPSIQTPGQIAQIGPGQQVDHRPAGDQLALIQQHQGVGQGNDLVHGMADIQDGQAVLADQLDQIGQDLGLARFVQGGQRFVHDHQARAGQQGAANGHPLFFASR